MNSPAFIEDKSEIHKTEPYVYSQTIAGRSSAHYGEAKNSWLTGTASWSFVALSEGILGIIPEFNGLKIKPCLPKEFQDININRIFRGAIYKIHIINKIINSFKMIVNNKEVVGNVIPFNKDIHEYNVEIEM